MTALRGWRVMMWLRRLGFSRNSMRRVSDRIESMALTVTVIVAVVALPIGMNIGQDVFRDESNSAAELATKGHETVAVLVESAPQGNVSPGEKQGTTTRPIVRAQWQAPDGADRTGLVETDFGAVKGDRVTVWTDHTGALTEAPATSLQIHVRAAVLGFLAGIGWLLGVLAVYGALRWLLDRRRLARWGEEWVMFERLWRKQKP
jgi:hypothetical protein